MKARGIAHLTVSHYDPAKNLVPRGVIEILDDAEISRRTVEANANGWPLPQAVEIDVFFLTSYVVNK